MQHLRVPQISARLSGFDDTMREPRDYEAPLCAQVGGDTWFPEKGGDSTSTLRAIRICQKCIHQSECAEWGIKYERHGIWGGLSAKERKGIRRKRRIILQEEKSA